MADPGRYATPPLMFVAGDTAERKPSVMRLVTDLGFDARDAGPLRNAGALEGLALLWIDQAMRGSRDFTFTFTSPKA